MSLSASATVTSRTTWPEPMRTLSASSRGSRSVGRAAGNLLQRKTVGIIGAGRIGSAYARMMVEGHKASVTCLLSDPTSTLTLAETSTTYAASRQICDAVIGRWQVRKPWIHCSANLVSNNDLLMCRLQS